MTLLKTIIKWFEVRDVEIPVFHIASMARSGETLLLHLLNQHPDVRISHNVSAIDSEAELRMYHFLMSYSGKTIPLHHRLLLPYGPTSRSVLIVKQGGTWEHRWPFLGIILSRNPVSIYASLRAYDVKEHGNDLDANWYAFRSPRLLEWLKNIDASLTTGFADLQPIDQFCLFYNRRMGALLSGTNNRVLHYENLVEDPVSSLKRVFLLFGLNERYSRSSCGKNERGELGHGYFDPCRGVDKRSLMKYKEVLTEGEIRYIAGQTGAVAEAYGYTLGRDQVRVKRLVREL